MFKHLFTSLKVFLFCDLCMFLSWVRHSTVNLVYCVLNRTLSIFLLSTEYCHTYCAPGGGHGSNKIPLASLRVPPFHCIQIAPAIMPSDCIHGTFQYSHTYKDAGKK